ncbi:unnamed protein product [Prorocentrum cordatum]|uniref:Uncharacterized protein n=1 Tax=Prorocentrum cordatum TaxID=2364126 RepID=A0ABN9XYN5_9DINO|nr:unnamed protein product [Polarella glacialis]
MELCSEAALRSLGMQGENGSCLELDQMAMWTSEECAVGQAVVAPSGSAAASLAEAARWGPSAGGGFVEAAAAAEGTSWMNPAISVGFAMLVLATFGVGAQCLRAQGLARGGGASAPLAAAGGGDGVSSGATPAEPASG